MLRGIDVSHHNGTVDWAALKSRYGITWGAAKATEGRSFQDSQFPANWRKMKAAGLVRMAYHFAHPDSDPADDARAFLSYVKASGLESTDIMVMDMEANQNNLPMLEVRDWLAGWADIITRETGRKPFLYVGSGYIQNNATKDLKPHYAAWWWPRYPSAYDGKSAWPNDIVGYPSPNNWGGEPDIWQFSQSFAGSLDANIANMTIADLKTRGTKTPAKPPVTPPVGDDMSAQDVSDGIRMYMRDFFKDEEGTGDTILDDTRAHNKAVEDKLDRLVTAVEGLAAVLGKPNA
jgi:lysozyme